jgi:hypothetical protein
MVRGGLHRSTNRGNRMTTNFSQAKKAKDSGDFFVIDKLLGRTGRDESISCFSFSGNATTDFGDLCDYPSGHNVTFFYQWIRERLSTQGSFGQRIAIYRRA